MCRQFRKINPNTLDWYAPDLLSVPAMGDDGGTTPGAKLATLLMTTCQILTSRSAIDWNVYFNFRDSLNSALNEEILKIM